MSNEQIKKGFEMNVEVKKLTWREYSELINQLYEKVNNFLIENDLKFSAIVPILREGGITGLILSYKFNTYKIIPIQFKYVIKKKERPLIAISELPEIHFEISDPPVFLIVDTLSFSGKTAEKVKEKLREKYPDCKLIYATLFKDVSFGNIFKNQIYAKETDGMHLLNNEERKKRGLIDSKFLIMPWGNEKEQLTQAFQTGNYEYY